MNDFNVTKKSKFTKQSETFSLRSFFEHIHRSSEVNLFQFSYVSGKGSHIKNLSDVIEGVYFS